MPHRPAAPAPAAVCAALLLPLIVIRHDRPDARYLEVGARFTAVGTVGRAGDATLIDPRWALTAAHVAVGGGARRPLVVRFGDREYGVDRIVVHPEWSELGPHDLALLRLAQPVTGITPLALYDGDDEAGQVATIVGHGGTGVGHDRQRREDGRPHGATNRVDRADGQWLVFTFDQPPAGTDIEGAPGPGDSGSPAILTRTGALRVAGVSSAGFDGKHGPGTYGAVDNFVRVSRYRAWISRALASPDAPSSDSVVAQLRAMLDTLARRDQFSGVVWLLKDDRPVFEQAVGFADQQARRENRLDTKFNIGSINKVFTRVAVLQLAEQGKLSLDDPISRRLPDYPRPAGDQVTIRHLLNMTSGLGDFFGPEYFAADKNRLLGPRDFFPLFIDQPLLFEPGAGRRYSNAGYIVLGAIIEQASGRSYFDYVREHIYRPAGMTNTDHFDWRQPVENRAIGYTRRGPDGPSPDGRHPNLDALAPHGGTSAGGGLSTAPDVVAFLRALRDGKLLDATGTRQMWGGGDQGWAGGTPGCNAVVEVMVPFGGYVLIVLSNYDPPIAETIARRVRQLLGAPID